VVWLERPSDQVGAGDAMILERLAAGIHLTVERVSPMTISDDAAAVEILVTASSLTARRKALQRLRLRESTPVRVVAARDDVAGDRTASLSSAVGSIRVALAEDGQPLPAACGVGERVPAMEAHTTLNQAVQALALSSRINPVVFSEKWGLVAALAASPDAARHPDVQRLAGLAAEPPALDTLEALALSDTVRGAAALLGLHHSTVQQRQTRLEEMIGYRISSPLGRARTLVALAVHRTRNSIVHTDPADRSDD
jgi:sugar diacid utilization regulator